MVEKAIYNFQATVDQPLHYWIGIRYVCSDGVNVHIIRTEESRGTCACVPLPQVKQCQFANGSPGRTCFKEALYRSRLAVLLCMLRQTCSEFLIYIVYMTCCLDYEIT